MKEKKLLALIFVVLLFIAGCNWNKQVNEDKLFYDLHQLLQACYSLFENHAQLDGLFFNENYTTIHEVEMLLDNKVTSAGMEKIVDMVFEERDGQLIYNDELQDYIENSNLYSQHTVDTSNYYYSIRETILNPGLQLIPAQYFVIEENGEKITVVGENVPIQFYEVEEERLAEQYRRYGYPDNDTLTVSFEFIKKGNNYLLDSYKVQTEQNHL